MFFNTCYIHLMKNTLNCEPLSYNGLYFGLYTWLTLYSKIYSAKAAIHGLFPWSLSIYCIHVVSWLPSSPARIKNWYHSKFQLILFTYSPLIPKLCTDKSESGGKWILVSHWLRILKILRISQWETSIYFPPLSDLSKHSFGTSRPNVARISWNFQWYQFFILVGPGGNHVYQLSIYLKSSTFFLPSIVYLFIYSYLLSICVLSIFYVLDTDWQ